MVVSCRFDLPGLQVDASRNATVDGPTPQYMSCMGLALTCGTGGVSSCCESAITVLGGTFLRGYDVAADAYNDMNYPATVSTFVLDRYEVTVGRFRKFVEAGMGTRLSAPEAGAGAHPRLANSGWDRAWDTRLVADTAALVAGVKCDPRYETWTDTPGINENKALNCVTWWEAMAFCIWDGGYLPTEAEWNYAASGGAEQRAYPWSNPAALTVIDCSNANYRPASYCVNDPTGSVNRVGSESPRGDGRWSHSDLGGNVLEWMLDWHVDPYPYAQMCNDCANLSTAIYRVIRGGAFNYGASSLRTASRDINTPDFRHGGIGMRCARAP